jgi:hypothetical protein
MIRSLSKLPVAELGLVIRIWIGIQCFVVGWISPKAGATGMFLGMLSDVGLLWFCFGYSVGLIWQ